MASIMKRCEADPKYTWATEDLFATDELWLESYQALQSAPEQLCAYQGRLGESAATLLEYFRLGDDIGRKLERLFNYAARKSDEDTANSTYQDLRGKALNLAVSIQSATAFDVPELLELSDETVEGFFAAEPGLGIYRRRMDVIRRRRAHILSPAEEALLASAGEMSGTPENIFGAFENADLRFPDVTDGEGKPHTLTAGTLISLLESADPVLRKNAFEGCYNTFHSFRNSIAAMLEGQVKQLIWHSRARKYGCTLEAALDGTEVPTAVYHNLIEAVHANLDKLHRYGALRKRLMGLDELHMYDLYTPIVADADLPITYEEAKEMVLEALAPLGEEYRKMLEEGFANRWIDVYENQGKRSGAYSSCGDPHPYVLLNHKDNLNSVFTLAHEMGHALHTYHSNLAQPYATADYVIFVAEVASTCNEVLLMQHLLNKTTDKRQRAYLINYFLEQFRTTLYRQTMFAEFELKINQLAEGGESLTADLLSQEYAKLNAAYYGDAVVQDSGIAMEWARIPHFYYNYYVFQYATGFSAAIAIAMNILKNGAPAVEAYRKFLSSGCSDTPVELLKIAGVDMSTPQPVNEALALFDALLTEMEQLLAE